MMFTAHLSICFHFPENPEYQSGDQNLKSRTLLSPISEARTCKDAGVEPFCFCVSETSERISNNNATVVLIAKATIRHMNSEMRIHRGACSHLKLAGITKADVSRRDIWIAYHCYSIRLCSKLAPAVDISMQKCIILRALRSVENQELNCSVTSVE